MKVLKKIYNSSTKSHIISLAPESSDDIYSLYNLIDASDQLESFTSRKVEIRPGVKTRISMKLCIKVESIDADLELGILFAKGRVTSNNEHITSGSYHTLEIGINQIVTIFKWCWSALAEKSLKVSKEKKEILFLVMKQKEVALCIATHNCIEAKGKIDYKPKNYKQILSKITPAFVSEFKLVVIISCYDGRQDLKKALINAKDMKKHENKFVDIKIQSDDMSTTKLVGNILENQENQRLFSGIQFCDEIRMVNLFLRMHNEGDLTCIGLEQIRICIECNALKDLLITNTKFKSFNIEERKAIEKLCEELNRRKINIHIIPAKHVQGEILNGMGGIGGIMKFNCLE